MGMSVQRTLLVSFLYEVVLVSFDMCEFRDAFNVLEDFHCFDPEVVIRNEAACRSVCRWVALVQSFDNCIIINVTMEGP